MWYPELASHLGSVIYLFRVSARCPSHEEVAQFLTAAGYPQFDSTVLQAIENNTRPITLEELKILCVLFGKTLAVAWKTAQFLTDTAQMPEQECLREFFREIEYQAWKSDQEK